MIVLLNIPFLDKPLLGAPVSAFLWCGGIILGAFLLKRPFASILTTMGARIAVRFSDGKYRGLFKNLLRKPVEWLFAITLFFIAFNFIAVPLNKLAIMHYQRKTKSVNITLADIIDHLFLFFAIYLAALTVSRFVDFLYRTQMGQAHRNLQKERTQLLPLLKELIKFLIWTIAFFWILGVVFEVNIPALIAGLGIGGIALALAAKETVENLFASLTILSDKPFQVGDTIKVGGLEGKVERIGFRSAKLRAAGGTLYVIPNKKLVDESLENMTQRSTRGISVLLNIKYGISQQSLQLMVGELKTMVRNSPHVVDPVRVSLETFNEKAIQLAVSYHVPEPLTDSAWTDVKQMINMKAYDIVSKYSVVTDVAAGLVQDDDDDDEV